MRTALFAIACSALVGLVAVPPPALAQQKTVKACRDEWQANKAANQAAGVTEKAYVDKCRAGSAATTPAATPTATTPAASGEKTVKACRDEWSANKAAYQAGGVTEKSYVEKCRAGETVAVPSQNTPAANTNPVSTPPAKPSTTAGTPSGADQFASEAQAKGHCPSDTVVWANTDSKVYHFAGAKRYGNTKQGAYMCEKEAGAKGFRAAKNEKRPAA